MENEIVELLNEFKEIKFPKRDKTYLQLCRYPYARFEEICSRLLQFFFSPCEIHEMNDLWLKSLVEVIAYKLNNNVILTQYSNADKNLTNVITEEQALGKRIDITIIMDNIVIAVENKVDAYLYNPLEEYSKYLEKEYKDKKIYKIVLSLWPQNDSVSIGKMKQSGFYNITYNELFDRVKTNAGEYLIYNDTTYKFYMTDFIKTLEYMGNKTNEIGKDFFYDNKQAIDDLIYRYNQYKQGILDVKIQGMTNILNLLYERKALKWEAWQHWLLSYSFNLDKNRIGIEAEFTNSKENDLEDFHIYITTWNKKDWVPYETEVLNEFSEYIKYDKETNNRIYLHLPIIKGNDTKAIVDALEDTYKRLKVIAERHM